MSDEVESCMGEHGANPIAWPDWQDDKRPVRSVCVSMMCWCCPLFPTPAENGLAPHSLWEPDTSSSSLKWKYSVFLYHTAIRIRIWIICLLWHGNDVYVLPCQMYERSQDKGMRKGETVQKPACSWILFAVGVTALHSCGERAGRKPQNN